MKLQKLICFLTFFISVTAIAQKSDSARIVELEHKWAKVAVDGDVNTFASMMTDEYIVLVANGKMVDKNTWVDAIRSGKAKYEFVNLSNIQVRIFKNAAFVTGSYSEKVIYNGVSGKERSGNYLNQWVKWKGKWILTSSAYSRYMEN